MISIGVSLQSERLDLIKLIARNIVGEKPPPAGLPLTGSMPAVTWRPVEDARRRDDPAPSDGDALQEDHAVDRSRTPPTSQTLIGLRPPLATIAQPAAYAAMVARLAASIAEQAALAGQEPAGENDLLPAEARVALATRDGSAIGRNSALMNWYAAAAGSGPKTAADNEMSEAPATGQAGSTKEAPTPDAAARKPGFVIMTNSPASAAAQQPAMEGLAAFAPEAGAAPANPANADAASWTPAAADGAADDSAAASLRHNAAGAMAAEGGGAIATSDTSLAYYMSLDADRAADLLSSELDTASAALRNLASADRGVASSLLERNLLALGLGGSAAATTSPQAERAGILASFILNAHFLPGWPPLRPIQDVEAKALVQNAAAEAKLSKEEIDVLLYLANFGLNKEQLDRLMKLITAARRRSKLLDAIASFFANFGTLMATIQEELELLVEELGADRQLSRAPAGKRSRIDLR